jgi:hypothetical protein
MQQEDNRLRNHLSIYRRIKQMINEKRRFPTAWAKYSIEEMERVAELELADAFLHVPVSHFEAIEEIKLGLAR